ncbi:carboxymuconolactone decarboxylase [Seminavis robusta]|uniref:Carboxymuconolactone decarboxylase n=1 Tax=Seminavis robusta TaxID=568900 RepID=A0A9N8DN56_9STRA|nr:carboxymuconolactone decarboxylase [Seminavis robusta]|eukprot:Sro239_g096010.1 carboxymuconolactone decarboxylase (479) ;mRNA; f:75648-77084
MTTNYATVTSTCILMPVMEMNPVTAILGVIGTLLLLLVLAMSYAVYTHRTSKHVDIKALKALQVPKGSLFRIFQPHLVPMDEISARGYSSVLALAQTCIGVQPTSDTVLELWKPAFQCYNLIFPNFLNLPGLLLPGYDIRDLVPLSLYVSSRANECTYCTSHCCSFAMRRGVDPATLQKSLEAIILSKDTATNLTLAERAVIRVSYGLGTVPACLNKEDVQLLQENLKPTQVEWIVAATAMMGSLNKYMDGLAIPLEPDTYGETMEHIDPKFVLSKSATVGLTLNDPKAALPMPPKDDWKLQLAIIYQGLRPGGAAALDSKLAKGVPSEAEDCIAFLKDLTGATFPVLRKLQHSRLRRALTAILSKNFVSDGIALSTKVLAGLQYCGQLQNLQLKSELQQVLASEVEDKYSKSNNNKALLLKAAKALSYNPSRMTESIIDDIEASSVTAENMVELVSFLATLQALHRFETYFQVAEEN